MKILDLVLKGQGYDMIASGVKKEEYREIKLYWTKRIMKCFKWCSRGFDIGNAVTNGCHCLFPQRCENTLNFCAIPGGFTHVRFRRGYTNITMLFKLDSITIGKGKPEWGAPKGKEVFILKFSAE